jgi:predicted component of type VI protein secretion system
MAPESESGMDELMRLSRQISRKQQEHTDRARQREEQGKKVRGVLQGLKELNVSMAIEQLKPFATDAIIKEVSDLKNKAGTEDLRRVISDLADDLEKRIGAIPGAKAESAALLNTMKTLNILIDLYFSLQ